MSRHKGLGTLMSLGALPVAMRLLLLAVVGADHLAVLPQSVVLSMRK